MIVKQIYFGSFNWPTKFWGVYGLRPSNISSLALTLLSMVRICFKDQGWTEHEAYMYIFYTLGSR